MFNKVTLIGRLTKDPEVRSSANNVSITHFTLAVNRNFTNSQGEREADFIPIVAFKTLAETCGKYLNKGKLIAVSGQIQTRNYEDKNGVKQYTTEVIANEIQFLDKKNSIDKQPDNPSIRDDDEDDELPF